MGYAVERASRPTILIYALIGAALALLVSGLTLDFGETPISMSVVGVVVILLAVLCLSFSLWLRNHRYLRERDRLCVAKVFELSSAAADY